MSGENTEKLSVRQLAVCAFVGGLAPAAAGSGYGWQGALLALPVILLAGWGLCALAPRWERAQDRWTGRVLSLLYALWGVALLSRGLSRCAARVTAAGGVEARHAAWVMVLAALPLIWMARGKPAAFFRACEVFYPAVAIAGGVLVIWAAFQVSWQYAALPAPDLWGGFWTALETAGTFLFALPYMNRTLHQPNGTGRALCWLWALGVSTVLLALVTAGVLSPAVAAGNGQPFFLMTAALGRAVRVEGLASALWLLSDLALLGLFARSWQRAGTGKSWMPALAAAVGTLCAVLDLPGVVPEAVWGWGTAGLGVLTGILLLGAGEKR